MPSGGRFDSLDAPTNVLVVVPAMDPADEAVCLDLLTVPDPEATDVLVLGFTHTSSQRIHQLRDAADENPPARCTVVDVSAAPDPSGSTPDDVDVKTVSSAADLTGLGTAVIEPLERWSDDGNQIVFCFHSLTPLLQYIDLDRAYRFLHVLTRHMTEAGAVAHYHIDPGAHDQQAVQTLMTLFDGVAEYEYEDDEWTVRGV